MPILARHLLSHIVGHISSGATWGRPDGKRIMILIQWSKKSFVVVVGLVVLAAFVFMKPPNRQDLSAPHSAGYAEVMESVDIVD